MNRLKTLLLLPKVCAFGFPNMLGTPAVRVADGIKKDGGFKYNASYKSSINLPIPSIGVLRIPQTHVMRTRKIEHWTQRAGEEFNGVLY